jgi:hypothetical protein
MFGVGSYLEGRYSRSSSRSSLHLRNPNIYRSLRNAPLGTVMDYGLDGRGSILGRDKRFLSSPLLSTVSRPPLGATQPHIQWVPEVPSPG